MNMNILSDSEWVSQAGKQWKEWNDMVWYGMTRDRIVPCFSAGSNRLAKRKCDRWLTANCDSWPSTTVHAGYIMPSVVISHVWDATTENRVELSWVQLSSVSSVVCMSWVELSWVSWRRMLWMNEWMNELVNYVSFLIYTSLSAVECCRVL
jgi:hypothetical protein